MAQFRQNHTRQGNGLQTTFRLVIFLILAVLALAGLGIYFKDQLIYSKNSDETESIDYSLRTYLPTSNGQLVHHTYYSLSYLDAHEQAEWVAYHMDRQMLNVPNVPRTGEFLVDNLVNGLSAKHSDYSNSGYTRGHLAPAGDMAFDSIAMRESFYMSNMSPQLRQFNNGVWKELEENIRDWTYTANDLYIVTGPIFDRPNKTIGKSSKITVPSSFYKVLLNYTEPEKKAIAFIIPNELSEKSLKDYMVTVDQVEAITGIDFFNDMINDKEEEMLESTFESSLWKISDKRYQLRISKWNYE